MRNRRAENRETLLQLQRLGLVSLTGDTIDSLLPIVPRGEMAREAFFDGIDQMDSDFGIEFEDEYNEED